MMGLSLFLCLIGSKEKHKQNKDKTTESELSFIDRDECTQAGSQPRGKTNAPQRGRDRTAHLTKTDNNRTWIKKMVHKRILNRQKGSNINNQHGKNARLSLGSSYPCETMSMERF